VKLHEIVDGLNKDNDNLRAITDHCEYLTDIIEVKSNSSSIYSLIKISFSLEINK